MLDESAIFASKILSFVFIAIFVFLGIFAWWCMRGGVKRWSKEQKQVVLMSIFVASFAGLVGGQIAIVLSDADAVRNDYQIQLLEEIRDMLKSHDMYVAQEIEAIMNDTIRGNHTATDT